MQGSSVRDDTDPNGGSQTARQRKLFLLAKEIGLRREERIDLAQIVLRRDIVSWKELDDAQVCRMLDALEGYQYVVELFRQRG